MLHEDAFRDSGASPPRFLGARLLVPIPFVYSKTFDQRTPGVNFKGERKKTAAERKRDHRAKEKAILEEIKKSQQAQSDRDFQEYVKRRLFERSLTQEARNNLAQEAIDNAREDSELDNDKPGPVGLKQVLGLLDDAPYMHYRRVGPRTYKKKIPSWTRSESSICELIKKSFPNFETNKSERAYAGRWAAVIHLYFRMGYTRSQIAHEIGSSDCKISGVIRAIQRASKGLQANGKGPRSTYGRGKHPNCRRKPKPNIVKGI